MDLMNKTKRPIVPPIPEVHLEDAEAKDSVPEGGPSPEMIAIGIPSGKYRAGQEIDLQYQEKTVAIDHEYAEAAQDKALTELIEKVVAPIRLELDAKFQALSDQMLSVAIDRANGISAQLVGGFFDCPLCGLRINGPSMTAQKGGAYVHPFQESAKLAGKQCELKGRTFKAPVLFLEFMKPLTPKGQ